MNIDINNINTLDEYLFSLGASAISLKTIHELQSKALDSTYLETDEREQIKVIKYEVGRALNAISSLLGLMDARAIIDINEVAERLQSRCNESLKKLHLEQ